MDPVSLDSIIITEGTDYGFDLNLVDLPEDSRAQNGENGKQEHTDLSQNSKVANIDLFQGPNNGDDSLSNQETDSASKCGNIYLQNKDIEINFIDDEVGHSEPVNIFAFSEEIATQVSEDSELNADLTKTSGEVHITDEKLYFSENSSEKINENLNLIINTSENIDQNVVLSENTSEMTTDQSDGKTVTTSDQSAPEEIPNNTNNLKLTLQNTDRENTVADNVLPKKQIISVDTKAVYDSGGGINESSPDMPMQRVRQDSSSGSEFDFELPPVKKKTDESGTSTSIPSQSEPATPSINVAVEETTVIKQSEMDAHITSTQTQSTYLFDSDVTVTTKKIIKYEETFEINSNIQTDSQKNAADDWENVQTIEAGFMKEGEKVKPTIPDNTPMLSYYEMQEELLRADFSTVKANIHTSLDRHGFSALKHFLFGPPKIHRNLLQNREKIFCIAACSFQNDNTVHTRALQTVYKCLTGSRFDCSRFGGHWEEIGFQGKDPSTDLRGAGMLGLLNLIYLLRDPKYHLIAKDIYKLSLHPTQNFPFCLMGINMSRITLQSLREDCLNKECNKRHDVLSVVNDFYTGIYLQMYQIWKSKGKTISDSGFVLKQIETDAKKNPHHVLKNLEDYLKNKKSAMNLENMDPGRENFLSVCDTEAGQY